jgi:hypothetical protein
MELKCGRETFQLTNEDVIMYNGSIYQLITKRAGIGWNASVPVVAKAKATKLIKDGLLERTVLENPPYKDESLEYYRISE